MSVSPNRDKITVYLEDKLFGLTTSVADIMILWLTGLASQPAIFHETNEVRKSKTEVSGSRLQSIEWDMYGK